MNQKVFNLVAGIIFTIVAIAHFKRLIMGFDVIIAGFSIPMGASVAGFIIAGFLACFAFRFARKM